MDESGDFARQLDSKALSETKAADILVEFISSHHESHFGGADVRGFHKYFMDIHVAVAVVVLQNAAAVGEASVFAEYGGLFIDLAFVERACSNDDLECRSGFDHVDDGPVFHLLRLRLARLVRVEAWAAGHGKNGSCFWIHKDGVGGFGLQILVGGIEFLLHDGLQTHVDGEADIFAVLWILFDATVEDDLAPHAVALDKAIAVLPGELAVHREFDALHAFSLMVQKTKDVAENLAIRVDADGVLFRVDAAQILFLHLAE